MPPGLGNIPRFFGSLKVQTTDLDPTFALPGTGLAAGAAAANLTQGQVTPDMHGLTVWNATGGTLTAGTLVYRNGWNTANNLPQVAKANASFLQSRAQWIVLANISNGASGVVGLHLRLTGQNTSGAAAVGDPIYVDSSTPGGYFVGNSAAPVWPTSAESYQIVGQVVTVNASTGIIDFDLLSGSEPVSVYRPSATFSTIGVAAGAYVTYMVMQEAGQIVGVRGLFPTGLVINGTNYVTFTAVNLSNASVNLLAASPANSTFTGGATITADTAYAFSLIATFANLTVSQGDLIKVIATVTGTLGSAIAAGGTISFGVVPT